LYVSDNKSVDTGSINSWSISFNNPISFAWTSTPSGFASATQNPGAVTPSAVGLGSVTYQLTATNSFTGCSVSSSVGVTVNRAYDSTLTAVIACGSYTLPWGGSATSSGTYSHTYTTVNGCDSVYHLPVTIHPVYTTNMNASTCSNIPYNLPWGGNGVAGLNSHTYSTVDGCDSVININLTINPTYNNPTVFVSGCDNVPYSLPWGGTGVAGNNVHTYPSQFGCDSVVTINLTVNPSYSADQYDTICSDHAFIFPWGDSSSVTGNYPHNYGTAAGCDSVLTVHLTVHVAPIVSAIFPNGCPGDVISILGSGFTNVISVQFNGLNAASYIIVDDGEIDAEVPAGVTSGPITLVSSNGCTGASDPFTVNSCNTSATVNITAFIQGYYLGNHVMKPVMLNEGVAGAMSSQTDTMTVELRDTATGAHAVVESFTGVLDTAGNIICTFTGATVGGQFYIVLQHRNSLETWSALPVSISSITSYDFSTAASQAFGNNQKDVFSEGIWSIYNGDVAHDGVCDGSDYIAMQPNVLSVATGYRKSDVSGDGVVDGSDYIKVQPNVLGTKSVHKPQ